MKKTKGLMSGVMSILVGLLTFGMYFAPFYSGNTIVGEFTHEMTYNFIFNENLMRLDNTNLTIFSIFSVILLVLAGCLVVCGIFLILQETKVIKGKSVILLNTFLSFLVAVVAVATLICYVVFYTENLKISTTYVKTNIGATTITIAIVACICALINILLFKKKSK